MHDVDLHDFDQVKNLESLLGHRHGSDPPAFMIKEGPSRDHEWERRYLLEGPRTADT